MKHYEIITIVKGGAVVRKNYIATDIVAAIEKALSVIPDATVADVEGAHSCGGEMDT